jgi:DNA-binding transcriptional MerR regulator
MNDDRRKELKSALKLLDGINVDTIREAVEAVMADEQDAFDNMPESLQSGERGQMMEEALGRLQEAIDALESAQENLAEATEALEVASK